MLLWSAADDFALVRDYMQKHGLEYQAKLYIDQSMLMIVISTLLQGTHMLQARLEGEPTSKTPRVPPAQSPGITPLGQEADSQEADSKASTTKPAPTAPSALQLNAFVDSYVEGIVLEAKSELLAEAHSSPPKTMSADADAPVTPSTLPFTEGSSGVGTASAQTGRSSAARAASHRAHASPLRESAQQAEAGGEPQQQLGGSEPVSPSLQAAAGPDVQRANAGSRNADAQQSGEVKAGQLGKSPRRNESELPKAADTDVPTEVAEIILEVLEAVTQHTHSGKVGLSPKLLLTPPRIYNGSLGMSRL